MPTQSFDQLFEYRAALVERMAHQPVELAEVVRAVPEAEWHSRRGAGGDTLHQVMAHLRDVEKQAFLPRFRRILLEANPALEPFSSHNWTVEQYRPAEPMDNLLAEFARAREAAVNLMRNMPATAWARTGFHPPSGRRTAQWWAERIYRHTCGHIAEIRQATSS